MQNSTGQRRRLRTVYFVQAEKLGLIKIGVTNALADRVARLRRTSPDHLVLIGTKRCYKYGATEAELHVRFQRHRLHGEWFAPDQEILDYIKQHTVAPAPDPTPADLDAEKEEFLRIEPDDNVFQAGIKTALAEAPDFNKAVKAAKHLQAQSWKPLDELGPPPADWDSCVREVADIILARAA